MSAEPAFAPEPASGVRLAATSPLVEPFFAVLFACGGHLSFQRPEDALDCMKKYVDAYATVRLPGKVLIGVPKPFTYALLWKLHANT